MYLPIHQWQEADRPREKALKQGIQILSDAELIALIFGTGTTTSEGKLSAIDLGRKLCSTFTSLDQVSKREVKELMHVKGIGKAKALQLAAAFEIGRRIESTVSEPKPSITAPSDVARIYMPKMRDLKKEEFWIVLLNTANRIIGDFKISEGGLRSSIVEPRAVFQKAILENAAGIVCLHNHPSGNLEPSPQDIQVTKQLVESGKLMGIPVHDHLIIAGRGYTSLAERGLM